MKLSSIWVYPIKSMAGISLSVCRVAASGLPLDRRYVVRDRETGKVLTAIKHPALLRLQPIVLEGSLPEDDSPPAALVIRFADGELVAVDDPRLEERLSELLARPVRLERQREGYFDGATVHLVTDVSLQFLRRRVGVPVRTENFRGNFQLAVPDPVPSRDPKGAVDGQGFVEAAWIGQRLRLGAEVELMLERGCPRCVLSTTDPLTLERNPKILEVLKAENEGNFGIYASVVRAGQVTLGSEVLIG